MERVMKYIEGLPEIEGESLKQFQIEVNEYDQSAPDDHVWDKMASYIDKAEGDGDKFLTLLEEQYKDLTTHLFNAQFELLDDFKNSDSDEPISDHDDRYNKDPRDEDKLKSEPNFQNTSNIMNPESKANTSAEKTHSYEQENKDDESNSKHDIRDEDYREKNLYDDDSDDDADKRYRRGYAKSDDDEESDQEPSYDPLDKKNSREEPEHNMPNRNIVHPKGNNMMPGMFGFNPRMMPNGQAMIDPRFLDQNMKMMTKIKGQPMHPMMINNMQMMQQFQAMNPFMMPNGMSMQMMNNNKYMMHGMPMNKNMNNPNQGAKHQRPNDIDMNTGAKKFAQHSPSQRPNKNQANSILVKNIPSEQNNIATLINYFNKFGEVVNVNVNPSKNTAVVRFTDPNNAREAYMCKDKVLGNDSIKLVYNPGSTFSQQPEEAKTYEHSRKPNVKAEIGKNLKFESEEAKKDREQAEKKRFLKQQRKEDIEKDNKEILDLVKALTKDMPEAEQQKIKDKIASLKESMNKKLRLEEEDKKKVIQAKQKKNTPVRSQRFDLTLKMADGSTPKCGEVLNKLKTISKSITDCKPIEDGRVMIKLSHTTEQALREALSKLQVFEVLQVNQIKEPTKPNRYSGHFRPSTTTSRSYKIVKK